MINRIEVDFAIAVELTDEEMRTLHVLIQRVAKRHQPPGQVHWCSGTGSKPIFSQADSLFLGKPVDPDAPTSGEPAFDDSVLYFETTCREAYASEL